MRRDQPVRIDLMIREGIGEHATVYNERAETLDQRAVTLDEHGERSLLVATPYLIASDDDVQRLSACISPEKQPH